MCQKTIVIIPRLGCAEYLFNIRTQENYKMKLQLGRKIQKKIEINR